MKFNVRSKACAQRDTVIANAIEERPTQHWNNEKGTQRSQLSLRLTKENLWGYLFLESSPLLKLLLKRVKGDMGPFQDGSQTRPHHLLGSGFGDVKDAKMRGWVMDSSPMLSESHWDQAVGDDTGAAARGPWEATLWSCEGEDSSEVETPRYWWCQSCEISTKESFLEGSEPYQERDACRRMNS